MSDKWDWRQELAEAKVSQEQVGKQIGLKKTPMSTLVKKMIVGKGLTATDLDKKRWSDALDYIAFKKEQVKKEA
ncbi:hypothetical protein [Weissella minor]|uniref:HTH cro/C1-type domain-containing protein n=1 Tax=Weissella minor TaxID=1620 RepID=A0A0R2JK45_9LACO|nr:hypothetical protein [Weissella minor]KRN77615.1 hypothetical protein IV67_GL001459 [Weissella minor]